MDAFGGGDGEFEDPEQQARMAQISEDEEFQGAMFALMSACGPGSQRLPLETTKRFAHRVATAEAYLLQLGPSFIERRTEQIWRFVHYRRLWPELTPQTATGVGHTSGPVGCVGVLLLVGVVGLLGSLVF